MDSQYRVGPPISPVPSYGGSRIKDREAVRMGEGNREWRHTAMVRGLILIGKIRLKSRCRRVVGKEVKEEKEDEDFAVSRHVRGPEGT